MRKILIGSVAGLGFGLAALGAMAAQGKGGRGFDRLDTDGDGKVTAEEMNAKHEAMIENADSDGDGAVTKEEMKAYHEARRAEWREKRDPDKNGDGVVDRQEYINAAQDRFERMDKNGNGVIDEDEKHNRRGHHRRGHRKGR